MTSMETGRTASCSPNVSLNCGLLPGSMNARTAPDAAGKKAVWTQTHSRTIHETATNLQYGGFFLFGKLVPITKNDAITFARRG
jgi:hypothetical protein